MSLDVTSFNKKQLDDLIGNGIKAVTLTFDNAIAGKKTSIRISTMISESKTPLKVKIAYLHSKIKDPDQLISQKGVDSL